MIDSSIARLDSPPIDNQPIVNKRTAVFFVASSLQYLGALSVAREFERDARRILVWYGRDFASFIDTSAWDAATHMPWPRFKPLPGFAGKHRRLLQNLDLVSDLVGHCDTLVIHSAMFDTETVNYMLYALHRRSKASRMLARVLPDGVLNLQRHPLTPAKRLAQHGRRMRALISPELRYQPFSGDRVGSDAHFVDRIYVLDGFPHDYQPQRVKRIRLMPTAKPEGPAANGESSVRCALVLGQPLVELGLMLEADRTRISAQIAAWLTAQGVSKILYKPHPLEAGLYELNEPDYELLELTEPLEMHLAHTHYAVIAGCCSTALMTARQIYGSTATIAAFGLNAVIFKDQSKRGKIADVFKTLDIAVY